MGRRRIRVLIVDDHPSIRRAVRLACDMTSDIQVVEEAGSVESAAEACARTSPDVVLLDLGLPDGSGLDVPRRVKEKCPSTHFLVLTGGPVERDLLEALKANVRGFLDKNADMDVVLDRIREVAGGAVSVTDVQRKSANGQLQSLIERRRASSDVTDRETEILKLLAEGRSTVQIAHRLGLSERTVEAHLHSAYRKLGAGGRVVAVREARRLGLIEEDPPP